VYVQLDKGPVIKINVPLIARGPHATQSVRLNLPKGASTLTITYGDPKNPPRTPSLIMFDRPVIKACGGK
jgi:hypothetical protein